MTTQDFITIGTGITVFQDSGIIEAPSIWLGSPEAVIAFVERDDTNDFIVIARGGTTTFLTPAHVAGVKGIVTLQGAPTSHLGIVSREYGIPCLMSVAFTAGNANERGEIIPPDGTILRIDVSTTPNGRVLAQAGAGLKAHRKAEAPVADAAPAEPLRFANGVIGGSAGEKIMEGRMVSDVLHLTDDSLQRDLTKVEVNDLLDYYGWSSISTSATASRAGMSLPPQFHGYGIHRHPRGEAGARLCRIHLALATISTTCWPSGPLNDRYRPVSASP